MNPIGLTAVLAPGSRQLDRKGNPAELRKRRHSDSEPAQPLHKRKGKRFSSCSDLSRLFGEGTDNTAFTRDRIGCKGLYLKQMKDACLPVPRFEFIDTRILQAIEKHPIDLSPLKGYLPDDMSNIVEAIYTSKHSLVEIKARISQLSPADKVKRGQWLDGLSAFIASDAFYEQVKESFAAKEIRACHQKLNLPFKPVIARGSGVTEDHFADVRTGRYQSIVHGEADILCTCLKVMASSYCSRGCLRRAPQPMGIILQECINCSFGGVAMSSLQDKSIRVEYVPGQPEGAVTGQSDMKPHCYIIKRDEGQITSAAFTHGNIPVAFVLEKVDGGSGFMEVKKAAEGSSVHGYDELGDDTLRHLHRNIEKLENLLCSPVEVEFGIDQEGRLFLLQVVIPPPGILDMPTEIIAKVISMLPMKDIKNCKATCKHINEIINSNYLVETCWFNKFPSVMQKKISKVFNRENYENDLRSWIQRFDNNLSAESFDNIKQYNNFPINLSFGVAQTLTQATRLKLVETATLEHGGMIHDISFSPDGRHLISNSDDDKVKLLSRDSQGVWRVCDINQASPGPFSPDSRHVVITLKCDDDEIEGENDKATLLFSLNSQGEWVVKGNIKHCDDRVLVHFSPDSRHVVNTFRGGKVKLNSLNSHKMWINNGLIENVVGLNGVDFSTDSRHLMIFSRDDKARLYSLNSLGVWTKRVIIDGDLMIKKATFSLDSCHLVSVSRDGKARLYSLNSLLGAWTKNTIVEHDDMIDGAAFSLDSRHLVTFSKDDKARFYSLNSLGVWAENAIIEHDTPICGEIIFSRNSRHLMGESYEGLIMYSQDSQGIWEKSFNIALGGGGDDDDDCIGPSNFSPDGCHVAIGPEDGKAALLSLNSQGGWEVNAFFELHRWVWSVNFGPDSRHVLIGSDSNLNSAFTELKLISLNRQGVWVEEGTIKQSCTERCSQPCDLPPSEVILFSPEGRPMVFTYHDRLAILNTLNSQGKLAEKASIEVGGVDSAIFSPEGRHLVTTTGYDNKVHVFEILPSYPEDPPNSEQLTAPCE